MTDMKLPKHKASLSIEHNAHKDYYKDIKEFIEENDWFDLVSDEDMQKCIDTDEIWTIQWYPDTPVGFHAYGASSLELLLEYVNEL